MRDEQFHIVSSVAERDDLAEHVSRSLDDGLTVVRDLRHGFCYIVECPKEWREEDGETDD